MRTLRLIMVTVLVSTAIGAFIWARSNAEMEQQALELMHSNLEQIGQIIKYQAAIGKTELNGRGWPTSIDPAWFTGTPPRNVLLNGRHPWIEIASPVEYDLSHPIARVALTEEVAGFWYNPGNGVVRARVPQLVSDRSAIELYNELNGSNVSELFAPTEVAGVRVDCTRFERRNGRWLKRLTFLIR